MEEAVGVKALRERFNSRPGSHQDTSSPKTSQPGLSSTMLSGTDSRLNHKQSPAAPPPFPFPGGVADPSRHASSPLLPPGSGCNASAQLGEISKVRQTGEMLQNMMLRHQKPRGVKLGSIMGPTPPLPPALKQGSTAQVTPLKRPLPPEGPRPLKPKLPPKVNLELFLRHKQGPVLPALRYSDRLQSSSNSLVKSGIESHPLPPRLHKPKPVQHNITSEEVDYEHDPYDDVGNFEKNEAYSANSSLYVDEDDEDVYEFIDEDNLEGSSNMIEKKDNKELKMQLEQVKKRMDNHGNQKELRKRFQLQGNIKVLHIVRVCHDWHGSGKLDLNVGQGESLEILRVKDNPEGKWLARSLSGNYGYISKTCVELDYEASKDDMQPSRRLEMLPPPHHDPQQLSNIESDNLQDDDDYDDVQPITDDFPPPPPEVCIDPKAEKELRKKFKYEGSVRVLYTVMVDPNGIIKKTGGKDLHVTKGEVVDVIQLTNERKALCRNNSGKYGYVFRSLLLPMEGGIYDDVDYPVVL